MKKALYLLFLLAFPLWSQVSDYEQWLRNEGNYLLTPEQKEKFRSLPDLDKELFIRDIWAALDPDPITAENEFKIEYEKRFAYAKKHYGIPSDRAKIYLLLGKPNSVLSEPNSDKYYPMELWSYYSLGHRNLPPSLELIFFKRWGAGDYRLYSPVFDGFKALTPTGMDLENSRNQARLKAIFDPNVIQAAQSLSTGASSMESEVIRTTLQDPSAMRKILQKQRPSVETTVVYEGFQADVTAYSIPYEGPVFRTSIAIAVPPNYLTFEHDKEKDIYQGRVDLVGKIVDASGKEIAKINDSPAIRMTQSEFDKSKSYYFSYLFDSYLLRGKYNLECIFRDYVSNAAGKVEKSFEVTGFNEDLTFAPLLIAYKSATVTEGQVPFGYNGQQYYPKENSSFSNGQNLIAYTTLVNPKKIKLEGIWNMEIALAQNGKNVVQTNEQVPLSTNADVAFARKLRLENLIPGEYILSVKLTRDSAVVQTETPLKIASAPEVLGRIRVVPHSSLTPEGYHTNVALQYLYQEKIEDAARHARIALDFAPASYAARSLNARIEKAKGNAEGAIAIYEKLVAETPGDSEGYYLIGKWSMEKKDWRKAGEYFKRALTQGYYNTDVLNDLAYVEIQLGNSAGALDYWQKSLALNANQPDIRKQMETYKQ